MGNVRMKVQQYLEVIKCGGDFTYRGETGEINSKIMVNKIDGNNYYVYTKPKKVNIPDNDEKFSLDYEKDGAQAGLKDYKELSDSEKEQAAERSGVRIEISGKGMEQQKQAETTEHPNASGTTSLLDTIRTFLTAAVTAIKDIFDKIWNNPLPEDTVVDTPEMSETADASEKMDSAGISVDPETPEAAGTIRVTEIIETTGFTDTAETSSRTDEENSEREIRKHLQNGDMEQVIRILTDNGRKTPARNSTLLTSYDKNGRMVQPDASVRQRTLYGDRNTRKL